MPVGFDERHDKVGSWLAEEAMPTSGLGLIQGTGQNETLLAGAAPARIIGVLQFPALIDEAITVVENGHVRSVAGAAVSIGDPLTTDANGKFITASTGDEILGYALRAAAAEDDVLLMSIPATGLALAP